MGGSVEGGDIVKLKVTYDTGTVVFEIDQGDLAALVLRKEREADQTAVAVMEEARRKRKLLSVEVV